MRDEQPNLDMVRADLEARPFPLEIRIPNTRQGYVRTLSGFFDNLEDASAAVAKHTGAYAPGIYATMNPLKAHVLNWNHNTMGKSVASAGDEDVIGFQSFYLDVDPIRPRYTCATNAEQNAAKLRANEIAHFLMNDLAFPLPEWAGTSGSGATARWRIDLEIDEAPLIGRCLTALDALFSDDEVTVDSGVGNPARLARIAGTINAKSPTPQPDRPWRLAAGKAFGTTLVTRDQLEALAVLILPKHESTSRDAHPYEGASYNLRKLLENAEIEFIEKKRSYGTAYDLASCLTSEEHDTGASFFQFDSGAVAYKCLHDSCADKGWGDVRHLLGVQNPAPMRLADGGRIFKPIKVGSNGRVAS